MSDKISLPIVNMRELAQQILNETENLMNETELRHHQILNTKDELPVSMHGTFDNFLEPFHRNIQQVLELRQSIGKNLLSAADIAESTEASIEIGFQSQ